MRRQRSDSAFHRFLSKIIDVRPSEVPALAWSWLYIFSLLSSYYIMRPIRDQMGVAGGVNNLQWLFTGTLVGMLLLNLPFSYLVKTFPREQFIAISYRFFAANILLFALALYTGDAGTDYLGRPHLLHLDFGVQSVRGLDLLADDRRHLHLGAGQAAVRLHCRRAPRWARSRARLFTVSTVEHMAPGYLMVGAAVMLEVAVFCVRRLVRPVGGAVGATAGRAGAKSRSEERCSAAFATRCRRVIC